MGHNPERDRKRYVLGKVHSERHADRVQRGDYDHVAGEVTDQERAEAEAELDHREDEESD